MNTPHRLAVGVVGMAVAAGAFVVGDATSANALPTPEHATTTIPAAAHQAAPGLTDPLDSGGGSSGDASSSEDGPRDGDGR